MKGIIRCLALCTLFFFEVSPAVGQESGFDRFQWGFTIGVGIGKPTISAEGSNNFTDSEGLSLGLGLFVETKISSRLHLLGSLEIDDSLSIGVGDSSNSISSFLSVGATLGHIRKPKSPFLSLLVGYSKVDIGDTGNPDSTGEPCLTFCFDLGDDLRGASSSGIGYRISIGRTINERARWSLSHNRVGGDADDLMSGSTAILSHTQILLNVIL